MITPQNFWLFFGGIWLFVGAMFLVFGLSAVAYILITHEQKDLVLPSIFALVGGVLTAVGGTMIYTVLTKRKLEEELRRRGMPAEATITEVSPSNVKINRERLWAIRYHYQDAYGKSHTASRLIAPEEAPQWQAGGRVSVKYDSQQPHRHVWLGPIG